MKMITNFTEANQRLADFYANATTKYTLDNMLALMDFLGNPQEKFKTIHVAGTSGKTSTAYYAAALLTAAGYKTGLTVSPHVDEINERLQINMQPLAEHEFCHVQEQFLALIARSDVKPSWFEVMVAFAYWYFAKTGVDYAVVEVGLGGLLDGTNVIERPDKVCIITDIGFDHTQILGNSLSEIAAQKAGIIKPGNQVFMYEQSGEVVDEVVSMAAKQHAELHYVEQFSHAQLKQLPIFQQRNFVLAETAVGFVRERDNHALTQEQIAIASQTYIPGRMEIIRYDDKTVILDGSHNAQKLEALATSLKAKFPDQDIAILTAFAEGDQQRLDKAIEVIGKMTKHCIATSFVSEKDYVKHSVDPGLVADNSKNSVTQIEVEPDTTKAFALLLKRPEPILLVTGSFYLLNHIRPLMLRL